MDLRVTATDSSLLPYRMHPPELKNYYDGLRALYVSWLRHAHVYSLMLNSMVSDDPNTEQPRPPLEIRTQGRKYILMENTSVQQSPDILTMPEVRIVSERILDLESGQKYALSRVSVSI